MASYTDKDKKFIGGSSVYKELSKSRDFDMSSYAKQREKRRKEEEDNRVAKAQAKNLEEAKKEGKGVVGTVLGTVGDLGKTLGASIQQYSAKAADVAIQGGGVLNELGIRASGGDDKASAKAAQNTEKIRKELHKLKDISGQNITGTSASDGIDLNAIKNDPRKAATVAGDALGASLGATQFINPVGLFRAGAAKTAAQGATGLSIRQAPQALSAGKRIAAESALFGGLGGLEQGYTTYGETGDLGEAIGQGGQAALLGAAAQAGLGVAGVAGGKAVGAFRNRGNKPAVVDELADVNTSASKAASDLEYESNTIAKQNQKLLPEISERTTSETGARIRELDDSITRANSGDLDYLRENGLLNTAEGDKRFRELTTENPENMARQQEAAARITEADQQIKYYQDIKAKSKYFRQSDNIEAKRSSELEDLNMILQDGQIDADPNAVRLMADEINKKYDAELEELAQRYPEEAMQKPALDQALEQVTTAKLDAQDNLNKIVESANNAAYKEANSISETVNPKALQSHIEQLNVEKQELTSKLESAQKRAEATNNTVEDIDKELDSLIDGTHPMRVDGASTTQVRAKWAELNTTKEKLQADNTLKENPNTADKVKVKQAANEVIKEEVELPTSKWNFFMNKFELFPEYLRNKGLTKTARSYEDAVLSYNRAQYDHGVEMRRWQKAAKGNKSITLFNAADGDVKAYEALTPAGRQVIDSWRAKAKKLGKELGLPEEILDRPYIPHMMNNDKTRNTVLNLINRKKELERSLASLNKEGQHNAYKKIGAISKQIDNALSEDSFKKVTGNINNKFLNERFGKEGYQKDFWKAIEAYTTAAENKLKMEPITKKLAQVANAVNGNDDTLYRSLVRQIDMVRGGKADLDRQFNKMIEQATGVDNLGSKSLVGARRITSLAKIGFSVNSIVNSTMQLATIPGVIGPDGALVGFARANKLLAKIGTNTMNAEEQAIWKRVHQIGLFEGDSQLLPEGAISKAGQIVDKAAFSGIKGADRYMRLVTFLGAEQQGLAKGLKGADLENYAWRMTNKANQNFSKFVAPQAFHSQVSKTMWTMMTFLPGTAIRSSEVGLRGLKGVKDLTVIGHSKLTGKPVTAGEFRSAVDSVSKATFMALSMWGMSNVIGSITGNGDVIPNPLDSSSWSSPMTQLIFGSSSQAGANYFLDQDSDEYERREDGSIVNVSKQERASKFWKETLPSFIIPGYAQGHRTLQGLSENEKGRGESRSGNIQFMNNKENDLQRAIFGKYSTPEAQEYISNLKTPESGTLSTRQTESVLSQPKNLRQQYYDYYRAADKITNRQASFDEVNAAVEAGNIPRARNKAAEFNAKVDKIMADFYSKYDNIDEDLQKKLNSRVYISVNDD